MSNVARSWISVDRAHDVSVAQDVFADTFVTGDRHIAMVLALIHQGDVAAIWPIIVAVERAPTAAQIPADGFVK